MLNNIMNPLEQSRGSYIDITDPIYVTTRPFQRVLYVQMLNNIMNPLEQSRGSYIDITVPIYDTTRSYQRVLYVQMLNNIGNHNINNYYDIHKIIKSHDPFNILKLFIIQHMINQ